MEFETENLPADWKVAPLGREEEPLLLLVRNGLTSEQGLYQQEYRVTRIETISDGFIDESKVRSTTGLRPEIVEKYRIRKDDILFSHINSDPHLGKTAIAIKDYDDLLHGMNLLLLRVNDKVLNPQFFHLVCFYYRQKGFFVKICSRSVNQSSINQAKLKALEVPLPPLAEQRKIAAVLGTVQRAIEQQEQLLQRTTELKRTLLNQLFTCGLRGEPQKETEIGPVPESWRLVPCEELCETITVGVVVRPASHYVMNGVPAFRSLNVREDRLETEDLVYFSQKANDTTLAKSKLRAGDVLVVRTGYPGTSCVVPPEYSGANCIDLVIVRPKPERVYSGFLSRFFNAPAGKSQALAVKHGLAQQHLNVAAVKKTLIPLPPLKQQQEIDSALAAVQRKMEFITARKQALNVLFRTLLHQLMTAQIRVSDLELSEGRISQRGIGRK